MKHTFPSEQNFFLFLELLDPVINGLLFKLRRELTRGLLISGIHVTIRGPYKTKIASKTVEQVGRILNGEPILIHGIGMFENPNEYVVYIKVAGGRLTEVCRKPDFPKKTYGCNPHISLYRGADKEFADKVQTFLKKEPLTLVCKEYRLIPYTSKQAELFSLDSKSFKPFPPRPSDDYLANPDIVERAAELVHSHRFSDKHGYLQGDL